LALPAIVRGMLCNAAVDLLSWPSIVDKPSSQPRACRLLIVDDDAVSLRAFAQLLTRAGYEVTTAINLAEARAATAGGTFDFVICDLGLPDGSGVDLMLQLREHHGLRGIALSGYSDEEHRQQARDAGFVDYLVKPVDIPDILRAIERAG
jgi:DNA-binding response OmpR family regulator